jgi:hypothetical protein
MEGPSNEQLATDRDFVGAWLVSYVVGEPPSVLTRDSINPLAAEALVSLLADGTLIASGSPAYPVPNGATRGERLLVGTGCGSWAMADERTAMLRCAALLRHENGNSVATVFVDATVQLDPDNDTFSGRYTIESHLSRAWTRNLPSLDGSVQGWRIGAPTGAGTPPDQ